MWRPVLMVDREWLAQLGLLVPSLVRSPLGVVVLIALLVGGPGLFAWCFGWRVA
jgi:hypothetical protein